MNWKQVVLNTFFLEKGGSVNPKKFPDEIFELYSIPAYDIQQPEIIFGSKIGSSKKCIQENDVLLSRIVPHIRRCWVVKKQLENRQIGSGEWIIFRTDKMFPDYLKYFLLSNKFHHQFMQTISGVGGSLLRARPPLVGKIRIPLPPLLVQQKIATILDTADALKQKDKALIAKYDELCQSLFLDMFGDPVINQKGWSYSKFDNCILDIIGGKSVGGEERPILRGERAVLKISAVTSGYFKVNEYKVVEENKIPPVCINPQKNDLLFSRANTREMVGAVCVVNADYNHLFLPDKIWKIVLNKDKLSNWYVKFLLSHDGFRENLRKVATGTSGSMLNISKAKLKKLNIPVPPTNLQEQFAKRIQTIEQQKQQAQASLQKSEDLFNCLLQKAFKGELVS